VFNPSPVHRNNAITLEQIEAQAPTQR